MNQLSLSFYDINIFLKCDDSTKALLDWLEDDFIFFKSDQLDFEKYNVVICINNQTLFNKPNKLYLPIFKTKMTKVSWVVDGGIYYQFHNDCFMVEHEKNDKRKVTFYGENSETAYEVIYTYILSAVGEQLDLKGLHRIHALAFSTESQKNYIFVTPSGTGKSTLSYMLRNSVSFFSDEMPLLKDKNIFAFPVRAALNAKSMEYFNLNKNEYRIMKRHKLNTKWILSGINQKIKLSGTLSDIYFVIGHSQEVGVKKINKFKAAMHLFIYLGIGWQLTQMAEFMIRPKSLFRIMKISLFRLRQIIKMLSEFEFYEMKISNDPEITCKYFKDRFI